MSNVQSPPPPTPNTHKHTHPVAAKQLHNRARQGEDERTDGWMDGLTDVRKS